jgi:predicted amidohydrolase YtcJ
MAARTAALLQPYADAPTTSGNLYYGQDKLNSQVLRANAAGFPVAIHAIGDRAVRQALDAYEYSKNMLNHSLVNRVEHANVVDPSDVPRFGTLGVAASIQPIWLYGYSSLATFTYLQRLGSARAPTAYAWQSLSSGGAVLLLGSDLPSSVLLDPITGIFAATSRQVANGEVFLANEALDADTALRAYTSTAPSVMGFGARLGKLAPGYLADLLWLDHDPSTGAKSIADDPIKRMWIGGVEVAP